MVTEYKLGYIISSMPVDVDDRVLAASAPPETVLVDSDESPDTTPSVRGSGGAKRSRPGLIIQNIDTLTTPERLNVAKPKKRAKEDTGL
jgi:hypothetical protein